MIVKAKPPKDDPAESQRFIDMAREVGASAGEKAFDKTFHTVAKRAPPTRAGHPHAKSKETPA